MDSIIMRKNVSEWDEKCMQDENIHRPLSLNSKAFWIKPNICSFLRIMEAANH